MTVRVSVTFSLRCLIEYTIAVCLCSPLTLFLSLQTWFVFILSVSPSLSVSVLLQPITWIIYSVWILSSCSLFCPPCSSLFPLSGEHGRIFFLNLVTSPSLSLFLFLCPGLSFVSLSVSSHSLILSLSLSLSNYTALSCSPVSSHGFVCPYVRTGWMASFFVMMGILT